MLRVNKVATQILIHASQSCGLVQLPPMANVRLYWLILLTSDMGLALKTLLVQSADHGWHSRYMVTSRKANRLMFILLQRCSSTTYLNHVIKNIMLAMIDSCQTQYVGACCTWGWVAAECWKSYKSWCFSFSLPLFYTCLNQVLNFLSAIYLHAAADCI